KPRSTSRIPSHQGEYRVSTLSGVQIREDRLHILGLVDVETGDSRDQELLNESGMANSRGQVLNGTNSGVRVSGLAMENKGDDLLANSGQEKMHAQGVQINDDNKYVYSDDSNAIRLLLGEIRFLFNRTEGGAAEQIEIPL
ncbi:MAG: hypothetical protein EZS28_056107, partial [Streblomastix strix]